jgi:haloacetate dehalogenase
MSWPIAAQSPSCVSGLGALERLGAARDLYESEGGPLALWRAWAPRVPGAAVPGAHLFPEEFPKETADALQGFLDGPA